MVKTPISEIYSQVGLRSADKGSELTLILALHVLEREDSSSLLVHDSAKTSLALNDNVGDTHLAAKGREEDNELDGVNVMCDDNERGLLRFDEGNAVVKTVLGIEGLLVLSGRLLFSGSLGESLKTLLLLSLGLRAVPIIDKKLPSRDIRLAYLLRSLKS